MSASSDAMWRSGYPRASTGRVRPACVARWLRNSDVIDLGGVEFEVIRTPATTSTAPACSTVPTACCWSATSGTTASSVNNLAHADAEKLGGLACKVDYILPSHNCTIVSSSGS